MLMRILGVLMGMGGGFVLGLLADSSLDFMQVMLGISLICGGMLLGTLSYFPKWEDTDNV